MWFRWTSFILVDTNSEALSTKRCLFGNEHTRTYSPRKLTRRFHRNIELMELSFWAKKKQIFVWKQNTIFWIFFFFFNYFESHLLKRVGMMCKRSSKSIKCVNKWENGQIVLLWIKNDVVLNVNQSGLGRESKYSINSSASCACFPVCINRKYIWPKAKFRKAKRSRR